LWARTFAATSLGIVFLNKKLGTITHQSFWNEDRSKDLPLSSNRGTVVSVDHRIVSQKIIFSF